MSAPRSRSESLHRLGHDNDSDPYFYKYNYQFNLPVSLEKARSLKNLDIAVLFVGRVSDAKIIEGVGRFKSPKIDSPEDVDITVTAVPFNLKKIIYYVFQTGEILGQRSF